MRNKNGLYWKFMDSQYGMSTPSRLFDSAKGNLAIVQRLGLQRKLQVHNGCVNSICWNEQGSYLLSGSDDQHLCITDGYNYSLLASVQTGHRANIFSARFLPNTSDKQVISCSGDGIIIFSDLAAPETSHSNTFNCHFGTAYEILTVPNDSHTFLSCGEDGTVRWFDLRLKNKCVVEECKEDILINCRCAVTSLTVNPLIPYHLGVGCADSSVRIFDRRMLGTRATGSFVGSGIQAMISRFSVPEFEGRSHRITSLSYSPDGQEMLVSYSSDFIYLFDVKDNGTTPPKVIALKGSEEKMEKTEIFVGRPVMKRLRVRGDWSDTGPNARPESEATPRVEEAAAEQTPPRSNMLQRMSDVLTRMFNSSTQRREAALSVSSHSDNESESESGSDNEERRASTTQHRRRAVREHLRRKKLQRRSESSEEPSSRTANNASPLAADVGPSTSGLQDPRCQSDNGSASTSYDTELGKTSAQVTCKIEKVSLTEVSDDTMDVKQETELPEDLSIPFHNGHVSEGNIDDATNGSMKDASNQVEEVEIHESSFVSRELQSDDNMVHEDITAALVGAETVLALPSDLIHNDNSSGSTRPRIERSLSAEAELLVDGDMDMENWDDEETRPPRAEQPARRRSNECVRASFLRTLTEELKISQEEREQMMSIPQPRVKRKYTGHRNARTMIKEATFWGNNFIMSGSDCGHIFIWDRETTELVMTLEADHHVVNCLQPHPFDPILASSGIDYDIKLWAPLCESAFFDEAKAQEIMQRNAVMLEETKDTITVPASFMIRVLASLNHLRSSGGMNNWRRVAREVRSENTESGNR